ncbi:MAG TPA: hypothetical protein VER04_07950 [Polyangiaceae bacterium]|nr:hypothetical protein [Polyangiaceae bacterium]
MAGTKLVLCGLVALGALSACGGDDKQAVTGQPTATQCPPGQYFDGRICQAPTGTAPAATTPVATAPAATAPGAIPGVATTAAGPAATPLDPATAQTVTALIAPLAASAVAPGAKPVGAAIAGNFAQGQSLEATVQMNPGKCYTIVGAGAPTIQNLDIQLVPSISVPGLPAAVVAADSSQGATAIVGQQPNCYKWALPMGGTMKVVVSVSAGQGMAAAQVYEK